MDLKAAPREVQSVSMKKCSKCKKVQNRSEFHPCKHPASGGLRYWCKSCTKASARKCYNPKRQKMFYLKKYWPGSTKEEAQNNYDKLLMSQNYSCAICETHQTKLKRSLAVDHHHESGTVRGLLCRECNSGLGHFKENIYAIKKSINYLNRSITNEN